MSELITLRPNVSARLLARAVAWMVWQERKAE